MFVFAIKILLLLSVNFVKAQNEIVLVSWNIKDFGKSRDENEIANIANLVKHADIIAIQEVVAKDPGGAKAVARLVDKLNRMGNAWDYVVSEPTASSSPYKSERYAYLWKKKLIKMTGGKAVLITKLKEKVEREPYFINFKIKNKTLSILNYHATTHDKNFPERQEIEAISTWLIMKKLENVILAGDMNLKIGDASFNSLKNIGFKYCLNGQSTTLKKKCKNGRYLSRGEDNILFKMMDFKTKSFNVIDFIKDGRCQEVIWKRNSYSDHLPIEFRFTLK